MLLYSYYIDDKYWIKINPFLLRYFNKRGISENCLSNHPVHGQRCLNIMCACAIDFYETFKHYALKYECEIQNEYYMARNVPRFEVLIKTVYVILSLLSKFWGSMCRESMSPMQNIKTKESNHFHFMELFVENTVFLK